MYAVIMAGGKGTRLSKYTNEIPKPMIKVGGVPIIERQINNLKSCGFNKITIIVGYLGNIIKDYFGDGRKFGVSIDYITEKEPLGSAGSLFYLKGKIKEDFILTFADLIIDVDFKKMIKFHEENNALLTLFAHPNSHPYDSDLLQVDENNVVTGFDSKNNVREYWYHNLVNAGLFVVSPKALDYFTNASKKDMEHDFVYDLIQSKKIFAYQSSEYVKDAGTLDRLDSVNRDLSSGIVSNRNLSKKQKCIFLDRDGTINVLRGHLSDINKFDLIKGVSNAIKLINDSNYLAVVVSNQPVVARGELSFEGLNEINKKMETLLGKEGAYLNATYICPHYPESGFAGEIKELKIDCDCRKPKIGLLLKAKEKFNIDLSQSWVIGDTELDVLCGKNADCKTILIDSSSKKYNADFRASDLLEAVNIILNKKNK